MSVSVVIPWRGGDRDRELALNHVLGRYMTRHPSWEVVLTPDTAPSGGEWVKAEAVAAALDEAGGDTIVVADADVLCDGTYEAVSAVEAGRSWAVPHHAVYRLTPESTRLVLDGGPPPDTRLPHSLLRGKVAETHKGVAGGGIVVLRRELWDICPMDARFRGWGQEDLAWGWALARLFGPPHREVSPLLHLWHPPAPRRTRANGSAESMALWRRYRSAYTPEAVLEILSEDGARPGSPATTTGGS